MSKTYEVIAGFYDGLDQKFEYGVGNAYPRADYEPDEERIQFLIEKKFIKEKEASVSELSVTELKEKLDKQGIEYPSNAKKAELKKLLIKE